MYWQKRLFMVDRDAQLEHRILEIHQAHPDYGYRRITMTLRQQQLLVNKKRVQRLMRKMDLHAAGYIRRPYGPPSTYHSYEGRVGMICPNRIHRRFVTSVCHQKITTDTTELVYFDKKFGQENQAHSLYLDVFLDMFNSEVIVYRLSRQPTEQTVLDGLAEAIRLTSDCRFRRTFHSDRGWIYQMPAYHQKLKQQRIFQSMSRKGSCLDNAIMENFFSILKREMYNGRIYRSYDDLKQAIEQYLNYYNHYRIKQKLNWQSPVDYRLNADKIKY